MSRPTPQRRLGRRLLGVTVLAAVAYPVSLRPACWALSWLRLEGTPEVADAVYWTYLPLAPATVDGPEPVRRGLRWWIGAGMPARTEMHDRSNGVGWSNPGDTYTRWCY